MTRSCLHHGNELRISIRISGKCLKNRFYSPIQPLISTIFVQHLMTNLNASTLEGRTTSVIRNLTGDICHELQFNKVKKQKMLEASFPNNKKTSIFAHVPWLMAFFFAICVGYWVPRLHELIARIAIQQFQGERSSWYSTGHFYGTPTQTSPHLF